MKIVDVGFARSVSKMRVDAIRGPCGILSSRAKFYKVVKLQKIEKGFSAQTHQFWWEAVPTEPSAPPCDPCAHAISHPRD